jgi:hypothetical protein
MTPSRRRWCCSSAAIAAAVLALAPRPARAQACCAGGALVTPTRLSEQEDYAAAVQMRARSNVGSFAPDGGFASSAGGEQVLEQDLAAAVRISRRGQVSALLPLIQTHRQATGIDEWGGGIGDVALAGRYDFRLAAEAVRWPGVALLAAATLPTGRPVDQSTQTLATDATGAGTYDATLGLGLEKTSDHAYAALDGWLTHRFARAVPVPGAAPIHQSFGLRWTALAVGGYVFDNEAAAAVYVSVLGDGAATVDGVTDPTTGKRLTTVGAAGLWPLAELWRLQAAVYTDVMLPSFGRNELGGFGLTLSLVRTWL